MKRFVKLDLDWAEAQLAGLRNDLETKQDDHSVTQHYRGQIATYRKIFKHIEATKDKPTPAPGPDAPAKADPPLY